MILQHPIINNVVFTDVAFLSLDEKNLQKLQWELKLRFRYCLFTSGGCSLDLSSYNGVVSQRADYYNIVSLPETICMSECSTQDDNRMIKQPYSKIKVNLLVPCRLACLFCNPPGVGESYALH